MFRSKERTEQRFVILVDEDFTANLSVADWLEDKGHLCSEATDILEALEKFSDFTLGRSPDFVVVNVASMPLDFDSFDAFQFSPERNKVTVLGIKNETSRSQTDRRLVNDFKQLGILLGEETRTRTLALTA